MEPNESPDVFIVQERGFILNSDISVHKERDTAEAHAAALNEASRSDRYSVRRAVVIMYRYKD